MKATIYIPEDKAELYEKAKAELGGTISAAFVRCMERELEIKRATMNRIVVKIWDQEKERGVKKAFEGRWIVGNERFPEEFWFDENKTGISGGGTYAVAVTKQNRIVVASGQKNQDLNSFEVHEDLEDFTEAEVDNRYPMYPESLIAAVKGEFGVDHIEELDI